MNKLKGLSPLITVLDVEKYCRDNYEHIRKRALMGNINQDYADGIKEILRDLIENYFGGL